MNIDIERRSQDIIARLKQIDSERASLLRELAIIQKKPKKTCSDLTIPKLSAPPVSASEQRLALYQKLFCCRTDVFPKLWQNSKTGAVGYSPVCKNEWAKEICFKPKIKFAECPNRSFVPLDESIVRKHLEGRITIGTYAIKPDDTCIFLAADFDEEHWMDDIRSFKRLQKNWVLKFTSNDHVLEMEGMHGYFSQNRFLHVMQDYWVHIYCQRLFQTVAQYHRKQLVDQWKNRPINFLAISKKNVGILSANLKQKTGCIDIGMIQTLDKLVENEEIISDYGMIIVDECHHVPAKSFELTLRNISAHYFAGLTATPYRKDGLHAIIHLHCGPTVHTMEENNGQAEINRKVFIRETSL